MLNNAGEQSETTKFCIFITKFGKLTKLEHFFFFLFADLRGGGERPLRPLWIRHC